MGNYGAGKSTFARKIGDFLGMKPVNLDAVVWEPHWQERSKEDCLKRLDHITSSDCWIVEGLSDYKGQSGYHDICFEAADTIIFFDFPPMLCWWRIFKRRLQYHRRNRPDLPAGYPEKLYRVFLQKVWNYSKDERPVIMEKIASLRHYKQVIELQTPRQVESFLSKLVQDGKLGINFSLNANTNKK